MSIFNYFVIFWISSGLVTIIVLSIISIRGNITQKKLKKINNFMKYMNYLNSIVLIYIAMKLFIKIINE